MAQFYKPPFHFNCVLVCGFKEAFSYSFGGQFCFFFALLEKTKSIEKIKPINNGYTINKQTNVVKICIKICNIIYYILGLNSIHMYSVHIYSNIKQAVPSSNISAFSNDFTGIV